MSELRKYVRTPHVRGSRFQHGDHDMEAVPWEDLVGKRLVVEEKLDGGNMGISFTPEGELLLQSRGHYLRGGPREKHFTLLKQWASSRQDEMFSIIGSRYVVYGEAMFAKHTVFYDELPHYFMEFDVLDTETNEFLDTPARDKLLRFASDVFVPVLVLAVGKFSNLKELGAQIGRSKFISPQRDANLKSAAEAASVPYEDAVAHTDMDEKMEGLYIKWEDGSGLVKGRYKFVRETFTNAIMDSETHWHDRPIIQNRLSEGALERMFGT